MHQQAEAAEVPLDLLQGHDVEARHNLSPTQQVRLAPPLCLRWKPTVRG